MYLNFQNFVAVTLLLFFALQGYRNKDYKFSFGVSFLAMTALFIPTQFFIDFSNLLFPLY